MLIGWRSDTVTNMGGKRGKGKREGVMLADERGPKTKAIVNGRVRVDNSHHSKSNNRKKEMSTKLWMCEMHHAQPGDNQLFCFTSSL